MSNSTAKAKREFFVKSLTPESINVIERECKCEFNARNEKLNTRLQVYEIKEFSLYLGIVKHNGKVIKTIGGQNPLFMILNYKTHLNTN